MIDIIRFLNEKSGKNFKVNGSENPNLGLAIARLKEGYTLEQLKLMTATMIVKWEGDEKTAEWIRPKTLFNKTNTAQYIGELPPDALS